MKVILLQDIAGTGRKHDIKNVADGYAQNFLLPQKKAVIATDKAVKEIEKKQAEINTERKIQEELLEKTIADLKDKKVVIKGKASDEGHLFAGVHRKNIIEAIKRDLNIELPEDALEMPKDSHDSLKTVGEHKVGVEVGKVSGELTVVIEVE